MTTRTMACLPRCAAFCSTPSCPGLSHGDSCAGRWPIVGCNACVPADFADPGCDANPHAHFGWRARVRRIRFAESSKATFMTPRSRSRRGCMCSAHRDEGYPYQMCRTNGRPRHPSGQAGDRGAFSRWRPSGTLTMRSFSISMKKSPARWRGRKSADEMFGLFNPPYVNIRKKLPQHSVVTCLAVESYVEVPYRPASTSKETGRFYFGDDRTRSSGVRCQVWQASVRQEGITPAAVNLTTVACD